MAFINEENARTKEQKLVMSEITKDGVCPFCPEHLSKYHKKPIHIDGVHWILTENQWPYEGTKRHLLAIAKAHVESLADLPPAAGAELLTLFQSGAKMFGITGGTIALRFGTEKEFANSVFHLHAHLIEPDVKDKNHPGVKFSVSKPSTQQK